MNSGRCRANDRGSRSSTEEPLLFPASPAVRLPPFTVRVRGRIGTLDGVVAPSAAPAGDSAEDWRAFGIFVPLFSLHSARSWGSGDLSDLDEFARFAAKEQASVISTLPLLAGFGPEPFEASPYLPVSRRFWHERWIDVERVPEYAWSPAARVLGSGPLRLPSAELSGWRAGSWTVPPSPPPSGRPSAPWRPPLDDRASAGRRRCATSCSNGPTLSSTPVFGPQSIASGSTGTAWPGATAWRPAQVERRRPCERELSRLRPVGCPRADDRSCRSGCHSAAKSSPSTFPWASTPAATTSGGASAHVRGRHDGGVPPGRVLRPGAVVGLSPPLVQRRSGPKGTRSSAPRSAHHLRVAGDAAHRPHNGIAKALLDPWRAPSPARAST